ncbi:MAG: hypothetical protein ACYC9J_08210 [Sulfuricaulis sp.]
MTVIGFRYLPLGWPRESRRLAAEIDSLTFLPLLRAADTQAMCRAPSEPDKTWREWQKKAMPIRPAPSDRLAGGNR